MADVFCMLATRAATSACGFRGAKKKKKTMNIFQMAALFSARLSQCGTVSEDSNRVIARLNQQEFWRHNFVLVFLFFF